MTKRPPEQDPRKAAQEYQEKQQGEERPAPQRPRNETEWRDLISHRIDEAMRNGHFDNLRNRGKPLNLDRNPYAPEGSEMAFDLLKNNGLAPAWIGMRNDVLRDMERFRTRLADLTQRYGAAFAKTPADDALRQRWAGQRQALHLEVEALNRRIVNLNLQQPIAHLEILRLRLDDELRAAGATWD